MNGEPEVSVIMANYNGARYLPAALDSLLRQTHASWELILVDDASTDDSIAAAELAVRGDPRVKFHRRAVNGGAGAARNIALDMARGAWVAIFDGDDLMHPHRLERLLHRARNDNAVIIADNLLLFSDTAAKTRPFLRNHLSKSPHWIGLAEFIDSNRLYSRSPDLGYLKPMIRRDVIRRLNLRYDESLRIGEDYHFLARLLAQGLQLRLEPTALYFYRKHPKSTSHRLSAADISALIHAERKFSGQVARPSPEEALAMKRRSRSLESLLIYDRAVTAIKQGNSAHGVWLGLTHPHIWPLLTRPIGARLAKFASRAGKRPSSNGLTHGAAFRNLQSERSSHAASQEISEQAQDRNIAEKQLRFRRSLRFL